MNKRSLLLILFLSLTFAMTPISAQDSSVGSAFEVDSFSYRVSFRSSDGTELLLIRARFQITYLYRHHQPTISQHYMSGTVGFYFGKTALGRNIVREVHIQSIDFRPQWHDAFGYFHSPESTAKLFAISSNVSDGQLAAGYIQLDKESVSRYLPDFGGILTIQEMTFVLDDGSKIGAGAETIKIEFEKNFNKLSPDDAKIVSNIENYTSTNIDGILVISIQDTAPIIVILDLIAAISIMTSFVSIASIAVLKRQKLKIPRISSITGNLRRNNDIQT
ncbi:MAG: hypothetical protein K9W43_08170 [Candidatus Thorarchaeota archaeon]|nr:hypothetical protein [Candidatus Thorarchaeota archaeon]